MSDELRAPVQRPAPAGPGPVGRLFGVLFAPRKTYETIVRAPKVLGALMVVTLPVAGGAGLILSTEVGQQAALEQQLDAMESFGISVNDEMYAQMERQMGNAVYFSIGGAAIGLPLLALVVAGVLWSVCYVILGAHAPFKAMFAVVAHAGVVNIVQQAFVLPLNYARGAMNSPSTLAAFFPMFEEGTFAQSTLGAVDLFFVWQLFIVAIGVGVLYGRHTGPIATTFYVLYALIATGIGLVLSQIGG